MHAIKLIPVIAMTAGLFIPREVRGQADECGPGFREIHTFKVGDIFQRRKVIRFSVGATYPTTEDWAKYAVTASWRKEDSLLYRAEGVIRTRETRKGQLIRQWSGRLIDTLVFVAARGQALDQCRDSLARIEPPEHPLDSIETRIRTAVAPWPDYPIAPSGIRFKILGGENNYFRRTDGVLTPTQEVRGRSAYGEGLGRVSHSLYFRGTQETDTLEGWVRDGDTVGTVNTDLDIHGMTGLSDAREGLRHRGWRYVSISPRSAWTVSGRRLPGRPAGARRP